MNWRIAIAYSMTVIAWGSAFPGIKIALASYSPEHLALLRLLIGSIGLVIFAVAKRIKLPDLKDVPAILLLGFLGFTVYHTALSVGEKTVSAGVASLLISITPIFSAVLAAVFLKERFSKMGWIGSLIAFSGVAVISLGNGGSLSAVAAGVLLILIAAIGESCYFVFQTNYLNKYGFIPFTIYTILSGTFFMLFFLPGAAAEIVAASSSATFAVIYLGLFPTIVPYFAVAYMISKAGASEATSSLYLTPIAALIISWICLGEVPSLLSLSGGILTLAGVSFSLWKEKRERARPIKEMAVRGET
ncbi:DMT family transporter [Pseudobacillus sp. 179-B 2D1 NHS]|uniref:DMT family transporter n=1 Tax=Pseudobacillus sp. 179-B 2D1 NHS TaxID=3374292 RepID=UPI00387A2B29